MPNRAVFRAKVDAAFVAKRAKVSEADIIKAFETMVVLMEEGREITIAGFGRFQPRWQEPRAVKSPVIAAGTMTNRRRKIQFKMDMGLRQKWIVNEEDAA